MIRTTATGILRRTTKTKPATAIIGRRYLATSAQKRKLSKQQLSGKNAPAASAVSGGGGGATKPPVKAASVSASESAPPGSGGGGGMLVPILGLIGGAAGGAYYMDLIPKEYLGMMEGITGGTEEKNTEKAPPAAVVPKAQKAPKKVEPMVQRKPTAVETTPAAAAPSPSEKIPQKDLAEPTGSRVTQIIAPPQDSQRIAAPPPPVSHAEDAHKVTVGNFASVASVTEEPPVGVGGAPLLDVAGATAVEAEVELRPEGSVDVDLELTKAHAVLRANLHQTLFKDLDSLSYSQLRVRVVQLAAELHERTKWEAVRLREFLAMKEKEGKERNLETMQNQRLQFEALLARRLREQEDRLARLSNSALQTKDDSFQTVLDAATTAQTTAHNLALQSATDRITQETAAKAEAEYGSKLAEEKASFVQELEAKAKAIEELAGKLAANDEILRISKSFEDGSQVAHKMSAAALALAERLETRKGAVEEVEALKAAAGENGVIKSALARIPESVKVGVPTVPELQTSFDAFHSVGRQAAHVPAGNNGLEGQIAGMLFAKMTVAPSPDTPPPVGDDGNMADYTLANARRYVQLGELEEAVSELDKLKGQTALTMRDWKKTAMDRIAVEKALKVIKMECALMNKNMAG